MRNSTLLALLVLGVLSAPALAEEFHLADGSKIQGATIGEANGRITILPTKGAQIELDRGDVLRIDRNHAISPKLRKKAKRARAKFAKKQRRRVQALLKKYGRADEAEREALDAKLDGYSAGALLDPLADALGDRRKATRMMAMRRLSAFETTEAVAPLVREALTSTERQFAEQTHKAAVGVDSTLARRFYETVAASQTKPARRLRALGYLAGMGDRNAVPGLVRVLEHVQAEIRATLATAGGLKRIPVNLGTSGPAGVNVPIELPEVNLVEVQTSMLVPVTALRRIRGAARGALKSLTGEDLGDEPAAWKAWWAKQPGSSK